MMFLPLLLIGLIVLAVWLARRGKQAVGATAQRAGTSDDNLATELQFLATLPTAFRSLQGEAKYMAAYDATMRLWPVPFEARDIPSRFGSTHLLICGLTEAPPLVLLHCFLTSLTVWAHNMADLSRDYRVYALDMMGQPSKSIPDQLIGTRAEMAEWLSGSLDALEIRQTDLIGYSYGGFAALNYAIDAPERLKKLILLSPAGGLVPLKTQFVIRGLLTSLPGPSRVAMNSLLHRMFYEPNLQSDKNKRMFQCMVDQMSLGTKYFPQAKR